MCQVPVEMPGEAPQSLQPMLQPARGAVLSTLLHSLVIKLSQDSVLVKAALEKMSVEDPLHLHILFRKPVGLAGPNAAGQYIMFLCDCWK